MKLKTILLLFFSTISIVLFSQKPPENETEFEKQYKKRIRKEVLYGVYIPRDINDAFIQLNKLTDIPSKDHFKAQPEAGVEEKFFYGLGRWIIHNWGFYGGSRFSHHIKSMGIYHPEDMAKFVIIAYHRHLNKKEVDIRSLMKKFHAKQKDEKQKLIQKGDVLHEEKRVRKKPEKKGGL